MKVAIIVDDLNPDRRRFCFWEKQLSDFPDVQTELVSLSQRETEFKLFDMDNYDVMIFNWDVINNDVTFNANTGQTIVKNDREEFIQFVREGNILIIEDQTRHWLPVQDAYDALAPGKVTVLKSNVLGNEEPLWAASARVNKRLKKHPLIHNLPSTLHSGYVYGPDFRWFSPNTVRPRALQGLHPTKIYSGAFQSWDSGWLPLIYTDDGKYPIILVKTDGFGLWVVSTMFFASANLRVLIENLVIRAKNNRSDIREYHSHYWVVRVGYILPVLVILIGTVVIVYLALVTHILNLNIPFSNSVGGRQYTELCVKTESGILNWQTVHHPNHQEDTNDSHTEHYRRRSEKSRSL